MAGRFTDWKVSRGVTGATGQMKALAAKLLGYLERQRQLGGASTMAKEGRLPDGSRVRVSFAKDVPIVEYFPSKPLAPAVTGVTFLEGVVVTPRTFASPTAFGARPEVLLSPKNLGTDDEEWAPFFYDETYFPTGEDGKVYRVNQNKQIAFPVGLPNAGQARWTNEDDTLCLTWIEGAQYIFYNGNLLFDAGSGAKIRGACLRRSGSTFTLIFAERDSVYRAALQFSTHSDLKWVPRVMPPKVAPPLFNQVAIDGTTTLDDTFELVALPTASYSSYPHVAFNRTGTEARTVFATSATQHASLVIDLSDLEDVTYVRTDYNYSATSISTENTYSGVRTPHVKEFATEPLYKRAGVEVVSADAAAYTDGSVETRELAKIVGAPGTSGAHASPAEASSYSETWTLGVATRTLPVAVEYLADNTPIYAYYVTKSRAINSTRTDVYGWTSEATATFRKEQTYLYDDPPGTPVYDIKFWQDDEEKHNHQYVTVSETSTVDECYGGYYVPGWIDLYGTFTRTDVYEGSSAYFYDAVWSGTSQLLYPTSPTPPATGAVDVTIETSYNATRDLDESTTKVGIWYMDLRTRSIVYSVLTHSKTTDTTISGARSDIATDATLTSTTVLSTKTCTTYVYMHGQLVDTVVCTVAGSTTPVSGPLDKTDGWIATRQGGTLNGPGYPLGDYSLYQSLYETAQADTSVAYGAYVPSGDLSAHPWQAVLDFAYADGDLDSSGSSSTAAVSTSTFSIGGSGILGDLNATWVSGAVTTPLPGANFGVWLPYKTGWVYSMAWLDGDPTVPNWRTSISSGETVDDITGKNGLELLGTAWPLSRTLFSVKT